MNDSLRKRRLFPIHGVQSTVLVLILAAGCGTSQRKSLQGNVTLDGQPLPSGRIAFHPVQDTPGPTAGAEISEGRFSIHRDKGSFAGTFRVEITAWRETGKKFRDPNGTVVSPSVQYLPPRYNEHSELRAEVTVGGSNEFDFQLHSNTDKQ